VSDLPNHAPQQRPNPESAQDDPSVSEQTNKPSDQIRDQYREPNDKDKREPTVKGNQRLSPPRVELDLAADLLDVFLVRDPL